MNVAGHSHLLLAGDPEVTARVRRALPRDLADKLVDTVPASERDRPTEMVMLTLSSFIEHDVVESRSVAERLIEGLRSHNLALVGSQATLDVLQCNKVDTLVMTLDYQPDPGWTCIDCKAMGTKVPEISMCPQCGEPAVRPLDIRAELLRLAGQLERPVEVVEQSEVLMSLGGVGCLLRTRLDT